MANQRISELDRRVTIRTFIEGQDEAGGNIKALLSSYNVWAKVENISGSRTLENLQLQYSEAYRVTKRYERTRVVPNNAEVLYENDLLTIGAIRLQNEGDKQFEIITAYTSSSNVSASGTVTPVVSEQVNYISTGGETTVQGTTGYNVVLVFRDGMQYMTVTGAPGDKQAQYDPATGLITFAYPMPADVQVSAYFIGE